MDKIKLHGRVEIAAEEFYNNDKPYIEMTSRLCYLDYPNLNGISLSSESDEESFASIVDMPIVAKINNLGTDFKGHEVKKNKDGTLSFNTSAYGTNVDWYVEDDEVDIPGVGIKKVPCYFAKSKIWKRFSNVIKIIKDRMDNGGIYSSWELMGELYNDDKGYKEYSKFTMLANTLLGANVQPAYDSTSKTLQVASKQDEKNSFNILLEEAFIKDVKNILISEKNKTNKNKEGDNMPKNNENSSLNTIDLARRISEALNPRGWDSNPYYSIWEIYPNEYKVICRDYSSDSEDELVVFSYSIDNEDKITIGEKKMRKLSELLSEKMKVNISMNLDDSAKLIAEKEILIKEKDTKISELTEEISQKDAKIIELNEAMVKVSEKVQTLEQTVSELEPLKAEKEEAERLEKEKEIAEKKETLKNTALKSGFITEDELESSEAIKKMIEDLDEKSIKAEIAERFIKKIEEEPKENKQVQTSEKNNNTNPKSNLDNDEVLISAMDIVKSWLSK